MIYYYSKCNKSDEHHIFDDFFSNEIFDDNAKLSAITVWESPKSSVRYSL